MSNIAASGEKKPHFPNLSPQAMHVIYEYQKLASRFSENERLKFYSLLSSICPEYVNTTFKVEDQQICSLQCNTVIRFPRPLPLVKHSHLMCGYAVWLRNKYSLPGFVEVEEGDIVIDCGAYVGGFILGIKDKASQVHAFEPDIQNYQCCVSNTSEISNITVNNLGLFNQNQTMEFYCSESNVEHSILPPDDGTIKSVIEINVVSLYNYCKAQNISRIDFLKLEAEGVEPEIFQGLGDIRPAKIAIDISPEREGESPADFFIDIFSKLNYSVEIRANVLFARA